MRALTRQVRASTAHRLWITARALIAAGERMRHPAETDAEIAARVRARFTPARAER